MLAAGRLSKARLRRMHDVLAGRVERGEASGIVTALSRRGEVHVDAIGMQETSWSSDPHEDMVAVLMVQRLFDDKVIEFHGDFWTLAYQAIDD
jgi:hypothetical protein